MYLGRNTLLIGTSLAGAAFSQETLDPASWPAAERGAYLKPQRPVNRKSGALDGQLVIGTSGPFAILAGRKALEQGGTAMDAAITTSLAQITLAAGSWNSFAGIFYAVYFDASSGKVRVLNAGFATVRGENSPRTIPRNPTPSGRTALVPGFMAGVEVAHRRFGKLPFADLFLPAIYAAERGFVIDSRLGQILSSREQVLSRLPATRANFVTDGQFIAKGDRFRQPALAKTLRAVAKEGADYMYRGAWASKLVDAVRAEGGKMTRTDLRGYRTRWRKPISTTYHGAEIFTLPEPELGAVQIIEGLNILRTVGFERAPPFTESAESMATLMKVCHLGQLASYAPGFYQPNPERPRASGQATTEERTSMQWAKRCAKMLDRDDWARAFHAHLRLRSTHSDTNIAVDRHGNVAVVLHSINAALYGSTGLFVDGVSIPDSGALHRDAIARVGPGARLPNMTNPLIALRDGKPILASTTIGSSLHECQMIGLTGCLQHGLTPDQSAKQPQFFGSVWRRTPRREPSNFPMAVQRGTFSDPVLAELRNRGVLVEELERNQMRFRFSYWLGVQWRKDGMRAGGTMSWTETTGR